MSTRAVTMDKKSVRQIDGEAKNRHYETDIRYALQMSQWFLRPMGLWCMVYPHTSVFEKIVSFCVFLLVVFVALFSAIAPINFLIFKPTSLLLRVKLCGRVGYCLMTCIKYVLLSLRASSFGNCIMHLERDWKAVENPKYRAIMLKQVSISRYLIRASAAILYTGGLGLHIIGPVAAKLMTPKNSTAPLPALVGYGFLLNTKFSHAAEFIITMQYIMGLIKYTITSCAFSLTTIFVTHIIGQIQIQIARLGTYVTDVQDKGEDPMGSIIRDHQAILRFSKTMCESFYEICLVQLSESVLVICTLAYCFLMEWENRVAITTGTQLLLVFSFTFNLFIFCYLGEMLSEQCSQIGPSAYDIEWYRLSPKQARNLIMLCITSLYPPKLTGGKMIQLCMITFSSVMQTTVVYLNLLRTFSN